MSTEIIFEPKKHYKRYYLFIFSLFYAIQGIHQAIPAILPYYFLFVFGEYDISAFLLIGSISTLPWSFKFFIGLINDKWGSERWGRRFPFILIFGTWGGIWWVIMAFFLPLDQSIYSFIIFYLFMANTGMAAADTALDGLILDVVPKRKLGTVQGWTWSLLMLGNAAAAAIGFGFYVLKIIPVLFLITGATMIISCILPYFITEPPLGEELNILEDTKRIVTEKTNYKVFGYTFISTIAYPIILSSMTYLTLITMGLVQVESAILSLSGGQTTEAYIIYSVIFGAFCGGGIVIGSFLAGKILDKKRIWAIKFTFLVYIPFCLISNLFLGFYFGLAAQIIFGLSYGALTISGQTIRGDIAKRRFPNLKSTFYALLISISNLGQSVGQYIGSVLYSSLSNLFASFQTMHFAISIFCAGILAVSYLIFRTINPKNYEFKNELEKKQTEFEKIDEMNNVKTEKS